MFSVQGATVFGGPSVELKFAFEILLLIRQLQRSHLPFCLKYLLMFDHDFFLFAKELFL